MNIEWSCTCYYDNTSQNTDCVQDGSPRRLASWKVSWKKMKITGVLQDADYFFKTPFKTHEPCFQDTLSRRSIKTPFKTPWKFLLDTAKKQNIFQDAIFFFKTSVKASWKKKIVLKNRLENRWSVLKIKKNVSWRASWKSVLKIFQVSWTSQKKCILKSVLKSVLKIF